MRTWTHEICGVKARTKDEAVDAMMAYYDLHPGRRRRKARDAFEVYRAKRGPFGWTLWVRPKRKVSA